MKTITPKNNDTKKVFRELGTCSRTFYHILNRNFDNISEIEERALDPLAGGILQKGHQCGMLWGAAMAVGTESFKRHTDSNKAISTAINATQHLVRSFSNRANTVNCYDITKTDFSKKFQMLRYMVFRAKNCFNLAEKWAPEAIDAAKKGLETNNENIPKQSLSCASETIKAMGGIDKEIVTVAGLAGGVGLSGNACGALSAAIWKNTKTYLKENPEKSVYNNPAAKGTYDKFCKATNDEMICYKIVGKKFDSIEEHSNFIKKGGCKKIIEALAAS